MKTFSKHFARGILSLLAVMVVSLSASAQYNPLAYWQFESAAPQLDITGNGFDVLDTVYIGTDAPLAGDYYDVPDSSMSLPTFIGGDLDDSLRLRQHISLEFWYRRVKNETEGLLHWDNKLYVAFNQTGIVFRVSLMLPDSVRELVIPFNGIGVLDMNRTYDGNWHHYVAQYDVKTGEQRLWIDGMSEGPMRTFHGTSAYLRDGGDLELSSEFVGARLEGGFDEVAIYDTLIPRELIRLHYLQALDSGQHYTFIAPPTDPEDFPEPVVEADTNIWDFGEGYPNVPHTPLTLLEHYPSPRYLPNHTLRRLIPWVTDPYMRVTLGHGTGNVALGQNMELSLQKLIDEYNSYLFLGTLAETYGKIVNAQLVPGEDAWHYLQVAEDPVNADIPRFILNNWRLMRAQLLDPNRPNSTYILNNSIPDPNYYLTNGFGQPIYFTNYGFRFNYSAAGYPYTHAYMDSIAFDGRVYAMMLDSFYAQLQPQYRRIDMVGENDETARPLEENLSMLDPLIQADMNGNNFWGNTYSSGQFKEYEALRNRYVRMRYIEPWKHKIDSVNNVLGADTTELTWYDLDGLHFRYGEMRKILANRDDRLRGTPHFYPQEPARVTATTTYLQGLDKIAESLSHMIEAGDSLFNPAVCPGFNDQYESLEDAEMVRPGLYLAALKSMAMLGADQFTLFFYHGNVMPTMPNWRTWQLAVPAYAQAVFSRDSLFWYDGQALIGDISPLSSANRTTWYTFETENPADMITARQRYGQARFLINGFIAKRLNTPSAGRHSRDVCFNFRDSNGSSVFDSLNINIREQGSTYLLDLTGSDTLFYQLDAWHEEKDLWHWCRDFNFEAEVFDTVTGMWSRGTERPAGHAAGDFSEFTSWVELTGGSSAAEYHFRPRFAEQDTLHLWLLARATTGTATAAVDVDGLNQQLVTGIDTVWRWYKAPLAYGPLDTTVEHVLQVQSTGPAVQIDKVSLVRTAMFWAQVPTNASIQVDTNSLPSVCHGDSVHFINASKLNGVCYNHEWEFGDGTRSYEFEPSHVYAYPGVYDVVYTLYLDCLDSTWRDTVQVTVSAPIVDAGPDRFGCAGDSAQLQGIASVPFAWASDTALSDTTVLNPFVNADSASTFYLTATDSNGCSLTDSVRWDAVQLPTPADDSLCTLQGQSIALTPGGVGAGIQWIYPASIAGDSNFQPVVTPATDTTYRFITWDACGCDTLHGSVTVVVYPQNQLILTPDTLVCPGDTIHLQGDSGWVSYLWSPQPGLGSAVAQDFTVAPLDTTEYVLEVGTAFGCSLTDTVTVFTHPNTFSVNTPGPINLCYGDTVALAVSGAGFIVWSPTSILNVGGGGANAFPLTTQYVYVDMLSPPIPVGTGCFFQDSILLEVDSNCCNVPGMNYALFGETASNFSANIAGCTNCTGLNLYVTDTFLIDSSLSLTDCLLGMDSTALIYVAAGATLTLDSTTLYGACIGMWEGIVVEDNTAQVVLENGSVLMDALIGVLSRNNGGYLLRDSELKNNMAGLRVEGNGTAHSGEVYGCEIHSDPGTMLPPYAGQEGWNGIYVEDVTGITIGVNDSSRLNTIHHLSSGIVAKRSDVELIAQDVGHISPGNVPSDYQDGNGRCVIAQGLSGGTATANFTVRVGGYGERACRFHDSGGGLYIWDNCVADVELNRFRNISGLGVYLKALRGDSILLDRNRFDSVEYAIDLFDCVEAVASVKRNVIRESAVGIYLIMNTRAECDVEWNDIRSDGAGEGIHVSDMNVFGIVTGGHTNLFENEIHLYGTGIVADAVERLRVDRNLVEIYGADPATDYGIGINVGASDSAQVLVNDVRWSADLQMQPSASERMRGIWMFMSDQAMVACNETRNWYEHARIQGPVMRTHIFNNTYYDAWDAASVNLGAIRQLGIYLVDSANVGPQGNDTVPCGNAWRRLDLDGMPLGGAAGLWSCNLGGRSMGEAALNAGLIFNIDRFYVKNSGEQNPGHSTVPNCNGDGQSTILYITTIGNSSYPVPSNCNEIPGGNSNGAMEAMWRSAETSLENEKDPGASAYISEQNLLVRMEDQPALVQGDSLLEACREHLITEGRNDILENERIHLGATEGSPQEAGAVNTVEANHRDVEAAWNHFQAMGLLTDGDSLLLDGIARQCPKLGGKAVFQARSLLLGRNPALRFGFKYCETDDSEKKGGKSSAAGSEFSFSVHPNPGRDRLELRSSLSGKVEIWTAQGEQLRALDLNGIERLEVGKWSRGLYLFRFHSAFGESQTLKILLQ